MADEMTPPEHPVEAGQTVLLVARASAEAQNLVALQQLRDSLAAQVGSGGRVDFEQIDRIEDGAAALASAHYDRVIANPIEPWAAEHTGKVLASLLLALKPSGVLSLRELVLDDAGSADAALPVARTQAELAQQLRFAGFVGVQAECREQVSEPTLRVLAEHCWTAGGAAELVGRASGHVLVATVTAQKPAYNVGAASALRFGSKARGAAEGPAAARKPWTISVESDDEAEIENEDALLEGDDLVRPDAASLARPDGAKAKRKPCKNCTCGLADGADVDEDAACKPGARAPKPKKPVDVVNVKSACGNCSLGDAFRCSSCPYLGMPAFKPGEKVTLGGSMLHDDFMP
ncbi:electron carrier [Coemansia javaensis]|uniref:Electron carrier n=1 Tax=Coemansia javaensis TaxID=2761396 RepID=A0A9W8H852_9FUNG|nr:electron carrier [Coemansia javaensis]